MGFFGWQSVESLISGLRFNGFQTLFGFRGFKNFLSTKCSPPFPFKIQSVCLQAISNNDKLPLKTIGNQKKL